MGPGNINPRRGIHVFDLLCVSVRICVTCWGVNLLASGQGAVLGAVRGCVLFVAPVRWVSRVRSGGQRLGFVGVGRRSVRLRGRDGDWYGSVWVCLCAVGGCWVRGRSDVLCGIWWCWLPYVV